MGHGTCLLLLVVVGVECSILHLYGQDLPGKQERTNKIFLGDEVDKLKPEQVRTVSVGAISELPLFRWRQGWGSWPEIWTRTEMRC